MVHLLVTIKNYLSYSNNLLPVIEYLENIEVLRDKKQRKKKRRLTKRIQSPSTGKSLKESEKINKGDEITTNFSKWVMPPQPQAYIRCPRHDFF